MDYATASKLGATLTSFTVSHRYWTGQFAIASENPEPAIEGAYAWFRGLVDGLTGTEVLKVQAPKEDEGPPNWTGEGTIDGPTETGPAVQPAVTSEEQEEGHVEHTRIERVTLKEDKLGRFVLELYPLMTGKYAGKPAKYADIRYFGDPSRVTAMLSQVWQEEWRAPLDEKVNWIATWSWGALKTGPNAKKGSRYRDLIAVDQG